MEQARITEQAPQRLAQGKQQKPEQQKPLKQQQQLEEQRAKEAELGVVVAEQEGRGR